MKILIPNAHLKSAITTLKPICPLKPTPPILGSVLIETGNQCVRITATNIDQRYTLSVSCSVLKPGSIAVPASRLLKVLDAYGTGETSIESDSKSVLHLRNGTSPHKLYGLPSDEFPASLALTPKETISIPGGDLKRILAVCAAHASTDDSRATLKSVTIRERDGMASFESGDGRRGCAYITDIPLKTREKYVVPIEAVGSMSSFDAECSIDFCESMIRVGTATNEFLTKCIECESPDFVKHIRMAGGPISATFNREEMITAIRRADATTNELTPGIAFRCKDSKILVEGRGKDIGEGSETVATKDECPDFEFGANPQFMLALLKQLIGEYVTIRIKDWMTPFAITEDQINIAISPIRIE